MLCPIVQLYCVLVFMFDSLRPPYGFTRLTSHCHSHEFPQTPYNCRLAATAARASRAAPKTKPTFTHSRPASSASKRAVGTTPFYTQRLSGAGQERETRRDITFLPAYPAYQHRTSLDGRVRPPWPRTGETRAARGSHTARRRAVTRTAAPPPPAVRPPARRAVAPSPSRSPVAACRAAPTGGLYVQWHLLSRYPLST